MCLLPEFGFLTTTSFGRAGTSVAKLALKKNVKIENAKKPPPVDEIVRLLELTEENQYEKAASLTNPLWKIPYEQQLRLKENEARNQLKRLAENVQRTIILPIIDERTGFFRSTTFSSIVPSPKLTGYRSKDNYVVNTGVDGQPATVGLPYGKIFSIFL